MQSGKHVLCEARMATNSLEAEQMFEASKNYPNLITQIVPAPHTLPYDNTVKSLIKNEMGSLILFDVKCTTGEFPNYNKPLHWREDRDISGNNIMHMGIFYEAGMRWLGTASNVFAHSDNLKEMAECMLKLLDKRGTIIIEVQYLLNTIKDLTFDNIYHEHYNYWSLTSLINFFKQFEVTLYKAERINTHGGSIRIYIKKGRKNKVENSIKELLKIEEKFGIKNYKTYEEFGKKVQKIKENVRKNIKNLKSNGKKLIGYGSPAKATTALNFFGISEEIDFIVEDNKLKQGKFVPGVNIPIVNKKKVLDKNNNMIVLAWNFYQDIKNNNKELSNNFVSIKDLEK